MAHLDEPNLPGSLPDNKDDPQRKVHSDLDQDPEQGKFGMDEKPSLTEKTSNFKRTMSRSMSMWSTLSVSTIRKRDVMYKIITIPFGIVMGCLFTLFSRYGFDYTNPSLAATVSVIRDSCIVIFDSFVILYALNTHYPVDASWSRWKRTIFLVLTTIATVITTFLRIIDPPERYNDYKTQLSKGILVGSTVLWWIFMTLLPCLVFYFNSKPGQKPIVDASAISPASNEDKAKANDKGGDKYALNTAKVGRRPLSLAGYVGLIEIFVGVLAHSLDTTIGTDLMTFTSALLIPWVIVILRERRRIRNDIGYMLLAVFFLGGVPLGAGSLFLGLLNSASGFDDAFLKGLSQIGVISLWALITFLLRHLFKATMKYAINPRYALVLVLPMCLIEHMFNRLVFLSEISVDVIGILISFTLLKSIVRDSGVYQPWIHRLLKRAEQTNGEKWKQLKENQIWLEMSSWHNSSTAFILFGMIVFDRYVFTPLNLAKREGLTAGIRDEYLIQLLWVYPTMGFTALFSHLLSSWYVRRQLTELRPLLNRSVSMSVSQSQRDSGLENMNMNESQRVVLLNQLSPSNGLNRPRNSSIAECNNEIEAGLAAAPEAPIATKLPKSQQSIENYWRTYFVFHLICLSWAIGEATWLSDWVRVEQEL